MSHGGDGCGTTGPLRGPGAPLAHSISPLVHLALALRLTDSDLVTARSDRVTPCFDDVQRICDLLRREIPGVGDDEARLAVLHVFRQAPADLGLIEWLAKSLVTWEGGRPVARHASGGTRCRQVVDADALVCWHLANRASTGGEQSLHDLLRWPPVLPGGRSPFDAVTRRALAEAHCHLGGALPPGFLWVAVLDRLAPSGQLFGPWASGESMSDIWHAKLTAARFDRELILDAIGPLPSDTTVRAGVRSAQDELIAERALLLRALGEVSSRPEEQLAVPLFRYLRVKNAFRLALLEPVRGRGLPPFLEAFQRRSVYFRPVLGRSESRRRRSALLEQKRMAHVVELALADALGQFESEQFGSMPPLDVELRVSLSPGRSATDCLRAWLNGARQALRRCPGAPLGLGFVVHLIKRTDSALGTDGSFALEGLCQVLRSQPMLRPLIVGVDAAGPEKNQPPRSLAPTYCRVREFLDDPSVPRDRFPVQLGFTVHVGEDFHDLLTGLRHIDEATHLLGLRPGDRLGHALALAWPPEKFYQQPGSTLLPAGDHLLDLVWLCAMVETSRLDQHRWAGVTHQWLRSCVAGLEGSPHSVEGVVGAFLAGCPYASQDRRVRSEGELLAALGVSSERAREPVAPPERMPTWVEVVRAAQRAAWLRVHESGLVIEANPTSNLSIGGFDGYADLPLVRLSGFVDYPLDDPLPPLPVSINTDDPGVFDTTLTAEFQRLGAHVFYRGRSDPAGRVGVQEVVGWLNTLRRTGVDSTFIPHWAPRGDALLAHLDAILGDSGRWL